jgi:hypothetical protein
MPLIDASHDKANLIFQLIIRPRRHGISIMMVCNNNGKWHFLHSGILKSILTGC